MHGGRKRRSAKSTPRVRGVFSPFAVGWHFATPAAYTQQSRSETTFATPASLGKCFCFVFLNTDVERAQPVHIQIYAETRRHVLCILYARAAERARFNQLKRKFVKYSRPHGRRVRLHPPPPLRAQTQIRFRAGPSLWGNRHLYIAHDLYTNHLVKIPKPYLTRSTSLKKSN